MRRKVGDGYGYGRGLGSERRRYLDGEGEQWRCRYNATLTHNLCCGSGDGMVWFD